MVMPCSRSARSPSVNKLRSAVSRPFFLLDVSTASQLIFKNALAVIQQPPNERALAIVHAACCGETQQGVLVGAFNGSSEIPFFFAVLHGGFASFVIDPSAAFGDARGGHFGGDFLQRIGVAFNRAGDG